MGNYNNQGLRYRVEYRPTGSVMYFQNLSDTARYVGISTNKLSKSFGKDISKSNLSVSGQTISEDVCIVDDYTIIREHRGNDANDGNILCATFVAFGFIIMLLLLMM